MLDSPQGYRITVFSDFICPFCYIAFRRLVRLREELKLKIFWRLIEIHPDNPIAGKPVTELGYPPEQWQMMMENLTRMAVDEGIEFADRSFTTNSKKALMLAEAAKRKSVAAFYQLSEEIFAAYFIKQKNIAQQDVLTEIASHVGITQRETEQIWSNRELLELISGHQLAASQAQVTGTPTTLIGDQVVNGAIPVDLLRQSIISHAACEQENRVD